MRRSKAELFFEIIEALNNSPQKLTKLMYKTNINASVLADFLRILKNAGYVTIPIKPDRHPLSKNKNLIKHRYLKHRYPELINQPYRLTETCKEFYLLVAPAMQELKRLLNVVDAQSYALEAECFSRILKSGEAKITETA